MFHPPSVGSWMIMVDEVSTPTIRLTRGNWAQWNCHLEASCQHRDLIYWITYLSLSMHVWIGYRLNANSSRFMRNLSEPPNECWIVIKSARIKIWVIWDILTIIAFIKKECANRGVAEIALMTISSRLLSWRRSLLLTTIYHPLLGYRVLSTPTPGRWSYTRKIM